MKNGKKATVNRSISCLFIRLVATMLACITSNFLYSQVPTIGEVRQLSIWEQVAQATGDGYMHYPRGIIFDVESGGNIVKRALANWQTNQDSVQFPMYHGWMGSSNGGSTWNAPSPSTTPDFDMMAAIRRHSDAVVVAIPFYLGYTYPNADTSFIFTYHTSADNGNTWTEHTNGGLINGFNGQFLTGFRFHRGIIQDADGTLYAPAHARWKNPDGSFQFYREMLMKSTNGGATWTYLSTIHHIGLPGHNLNETSIVRCRDGSILAVIRRNGNGQNQLTRPLVTCRSTDNGLTWGSLDSLAVPYNQGVDPYLYMLHNGVLVLSYGDNIQGKTMRDIYLAFSADGNGTNWTNLTKTFTSDTVGLGKKSSGYTTVLPTHTNRFYQLSDRGLWTFYGTNRHPTPNPFSIWRKPIDVVLNYRNRIDLKSKYATGDISVTTDLTYSNATHPEVRIAGVIDGNTDYWNGAFKVGSSGYYTIDLKSNHTINAIGVCLINGASESATIEYSTDSVSWSTLKTYTNATHYTMDYTSLGSPVTLRYVRVNVTGSSMVGLNEIRLFSTGDTYEDYGLNYVPYGYTITPQSSGFKVSAGIPALPTGYKSERALYMEDLDPADVKEISKYGVTNGSKTLELKVRVKAFASGGAIQFRFRSGSTNVFRISIFSDGSIRYYSGGSYTIIGTAGTIPLDTWKHLKISTNAVTNVVNVYVDGTLIGSGTKETPSATSMDGFTFSSGGIAANGDKALFDDVEFYGGSTPGSRPGKEAAPEPVEEEIISKLKLTVSPNPAHQNVNLVIEHPSEGRADIQFINAQGQAAKILSYNGSKGRITKNIHVGDLAAGIYFIVVKQGQELVKSKVVIN